MKREYHFFVSGKNRLLQYYLDDFTKDANKIGWSLAGGSLLDINVLDFNWEGRCFCLRNSKREK